MIWRKAPSKTVLVIRLLMAAIFIVYGGVKLAGGQYYYGDWNDMAKSTVDGTSLVWLFYGYSPFYGRVTGLFELVPAIMLLFRRTTFTGACALFVVGLNITLMDFAFDYPFVKYMAALYTVLCGFLVLHDRAKLRDIFADPQVVPPAGSGVARERPGSSSRRRCTTSARPCTRPRCSRRTCAGWAWSGTGCAGGIRR
ncbi:hypothetical protein [Lentzea sp. NPDC004782]|uniref:hypothetical protein n=1 Tax=Lentzea sp. NPDC004782 TaxID=3154458 RepID=UPI0033ADAB21